MEDRETARMRKYGESKMTQNMMATVPHVTSGLGLRKFQADGFLLTRMYICVHVLNEPSKTIMVDNLDNYLQIYSTVTNFLTLFVTLLLSLICDISSILLFVFLPPIICDTERVTM